MSITDRIKNAWNAFNYEDQQNILVDPWSSDYVTQHGGTRPDKTYRSTKGDKTIITAICNRIAIDASSMKYKHIRTDSEGRYIDDEDSYLNECLTLSANVDQSGRAFMQDVVLSMLDEGVVAIVPTDTTMNINSSNSFDILALRVGAVNAWYPDKVKVSVYNEKKGIRQDIIVPKNKVAIIENPLYPVMNGPNSTLQRLIRKLHQMDTIDMKNSSGKLDLIIQLPYVIKNEARLSQAEKRRESIEEQLVDSKYGIAYTDSTEKITQLNRPVENNILNHVEYLTSMLYSQLGLTEGIFNGDADEKALLNYYNRTIEPIATAIVDEMKRKFLTRTAITQGQSIMYFREPFKLVPTNDLAEIADKFTRNEILTSNEFRSILGFEPSQDPTADELRNKNLNRKDNVVESGSPEPETNIDKEEDTN